MKFFITIFILFFYSNVIAQSNSNKIIGYWVYEKILSNNLDEEAVYNKMNIGAIIYFKKDGCFISFKQKKNTKIILGQGKYFLKNKLLIQDGVSLKIKYLTEKSLVLIISNNKQLILKKLTHANNE